MIKKYLPFFIFTLLMLSWFIYANTVGLNKTKNSCKNEKKIFFNRKVKDIIQDSINPPLKKIVFADGTEYEYEYTYGLWIGLNKGDSVVKKANTLQYIIYRNCDTMQVDTFYRNEDCDEIRLKRV